MNDISLLERRISVNALGMEGPHTLDEVCIGSLGLEASPGNYALGYTNSGGDFVVCFVGRSDDDLSARLLSWVGRSEFRQFKFSYAGSPEEAFEKECETYHHFKPIGNRMHPSRPIGTGWKCPRCPFFD